MQQQITRNDYISVINMVVSHQLQKQICMKIYLSKKSDRGNILTLQKLTLTTSRDSRPRYELQVTHISCQ